MKAYDGDSRYDFCQIQAPVGRLYMSCVEDEIKRRMKPGVVYVMSYSARTGDCGKRVTVKKKIQMVEDCGSFILFRNKKGFCTCILYQDLYQMISKSRFYPAASAFHN